MRKYTCVEGFSGPGGIALGFKRAGFKVLFAFDHNERAVQTYRSNLDSSCECRCATKTTGEDIREAASQSFDELDLFSGGPPCQGFSKQKRGAHNGDKRNSLVLEYIRLVEELHPRMFFLENVVMFAKKRGRALLEELFARLSDYSLFPHVYNCADYGLAQTRERFVLVGKRSDVQSEFAIPLPTVSIWATVGEALAGLPEPPEDYSHHPDYPNHQRARVTETNIHRFSFVPPGGGWEDIPMEFRLKCHQTVDRKSGGWPDVYGRLCADSQCPTITGGFDSFTRGRYGHPHHDRPLTPREAARLQGFPDDFVFQGTRGDIRSQIGNAVPPPLAEAIGKSILHTLKVQDGVLNECDRPGRHPSREHQISGDRFNE